MWNPRAFHRSKPIRFVSNRIRCFLKLPVLLTNGKPTKRQTAGYPTFRGTCNSQKGAFVHEARCLQSLTGLALDSKQYPGFIHPKAAFLAAPGPKANLVLPVNFDSEFVDNLGKTTPLSSEEFDERSGVSVQIRGVNEPEGLIFAHPNQAEFAISTGRDLRHPVVSHPCVIGDWLTARGVEVQIFEDEDLSLIHI